MRAERMLLVTALAAGLCLTSASVAFASTESTYATWVDTVTDHSQPHATPHRDYATTTTKCAVCHAVHKAPATGELLLRSTVGNACVYCHIETDIGGIVIYDGVVANYTTEDEHGHQSTGVTCVDCHSVHGANTYKGAMVTKILKVGAIQPSYLDYITSGSNDTSVVINADDSAWTGWAGPWPGAFCSQCHPYFSNASEDTITASVVQSDGGRLTKSFKTHPLKKPGKENGHDYYEGFEASGSIVPMDEAVAAKGPNGCGAQCHSSPEPGDTGAAGPDNSYPHWNVHTSRFLHGAPGAWGEDQTVENSTDDAACLECHVWDESGGGTGPDGGTAAPRPGGVGISY
jgi:predicted CXXCH cytochrome family protein